MAKDGGDAYQKRRKLVIETAAQVFKEKGYEAANINDIANRLGTDRATLYYYAGSKEELLNEIVTLVLDENLKLAKTIAAKKGDPRVRLSALIAEMISSYDRNYPFMYVYIQDMPRMADQNIEWAKDTVAKTRKFESMVVKILRDGQQAGIFREDISIELVEFALFGMINWTHRWYKPGGPASPEEVADSICAIFFDGVSINHSER